MQKTKPGDDCRTNLSKHQGEDADKVFATFGRVKPRGDASSFSCSSDAAGDVLIVLHRQGRIYFLV